MSDYFGNVLPLYSSPVYYLPKTDYEFTHEERNYVDSLENSGSQHMFLSKNTNVFGDLTNIKNFCVDKLNIYTKEILGIKQNFYITNSWVSKKTKGQSHHIHNHPNSIFSGVFYMSVEDKDSKLHFNSTPGHLKGFNFDFDYESFNLFNSQDWWISVESGSFIIFPSHLNHYVQENQSDTERIVIGFNTFVEGYLGSNGYCTDLNL